MPIRQNSLPATLSGRNVPRRKPTLFMTGTSQSLPVFVEAPEEKKSTDNDTNNDRAISILTHTIETIDLANNFVPLALAKGVLSTVSSLLTLVKTTIENKNDFVGVAEQCNKITMMLWRATSGKTEEDISLPVQSAIAELQTSVNEILEAVRAKTNSGIASQVFHATINHGTIAGWQQELDRFLVLFNTELNLATNSKMEELVLKFDELRVNLVAPKFDDPIPIPIPPKPSVFVGREDLVHEATQGLIKQQNIALIGPGGMGKTFIARAILNDPTISATFGERRFFARYDDIDASQITYGTFVNHLATSLGLPGSRGKALALINITLSSTKPTLLVFDNAETFLDAEKDGGAIADCINEVGALPNVVILMTSRSTILPSNLPWERVRIPALDQTPASDLFKQVYKQEIGSDVLQNLLESVDFHPLSINLLAQVAVQNEWTPADLVKSWEQQHASLLHTGSGKVQSLAATITLSVKSPSLQKHQDIISKLLPVIAFLPQGINKSTIEKVYPNVPQIQTITELLCKHSLTYVKGDFITMLAPIRLHFTRGIRELSDMPMLAEVYQYYLSKAEEEPLDEAWFLAEDINIEHLLATLLQNSTALELLIEVASAAGDYIGALATTRPRPTSLRPIIVAMRCEQSKSVMDHLHYRQHKQRRTYLNMKGKCVLQLGILAYSLGMLEEARDYLMQGYHILERAGIIASKHFRSLTFAVAATHMTLGGFVNTQEALETDLGRPHRWWSRTSTDIDIAAPLVLESIKIARGQSQDSHGFLKLAKRVKHMEDKSLCGFCLSTVVLAARMLGKSEEANKISAFTLDIEETKFEGAVLHADFAMFEGDVAQALAYLDAVDPLSPQVVFDDAIAYYQLHAACKLRDGKAAEARDIAHKLVSETRFTNNLMAAAASAWIGGWMELHEGDLTAASSFLTKAVNLSEASSDKITLALARRALGEVAFMEKDYVEAAAQFKRVESLCSAMGIQNTFLFDCGWTYWRTESRFGGWRAFSQREDPFSKEQS